MKEALLFDINLVGKKYPEVLCKINLFLKSLVSSGFQHGLRTSSSPGIFRDSSIRLGLLGIQPHELNSYWMLSISIVRQTSLDYPDYIL